MADEQLLGWGGDAVGLDVIFHNANRPGISVNHQHRANDQRATKRPHEHFSPHRAQLKAVLLPFAAPRYHQIDKPRAGQQTNDPTSGRTDSPIRPPAQKCERRVNRRDRAPVGRQKRARAPDQQPTQCNDKRRDFHIGGQIPVQPANQRPCADADNNRDDPDRRMAKPQILRQKINLQQAHHHAGHPNE